MNWLAAEVIAWVATIASWMLASLFAWLPQRARYKQEVTLKVGDRATPQERARAELELERENRFKPAFSDVAWDRAVAPLIVFFGLLSVNADTRYRMYVSFFLFGAALIVTAVHSHLWVGYRATKWQWLFVMGWWAAGLPAAAYVGVKSPLKAEDGDATTVLHSAHASKGTRTFRVKWCSASRSTTSRTTST